MSATLRAQLEHAIVESLGAPFQIVALHSVSGGCIHRCYALETAQGRYFLKLSEAARAATLKAEADGLRAMHAAGVRVPAVITAGELADGAFLLLEFLDLAPAPPAAQRALGRALAHLHMHTADRYGWHADNFIGLTPQRNAWHDDWPGFWITQRLQPQLELAANNGHAGTLQALGDRLIEAVPALLGERRVPAALLHGDLWGGNAGALADGTPVMFDPAVYYGDPEADLAMTELFGGFTPEFYAGYREGNAIDGGYTLRKHVYNLYHVLNHLNLFGGSYLQQAERMMRKLLAETR